jgi:hypothetical protein
MDLERTLCRLHCGVTTRQMLVAERTRSYLVKFFLHTRVIESIILEKSSC